MKIFMNVTEWKRHSLKKHSKMTEVDISSHDVGIRDLRRIADELLFEIILICKTEVEKDAHNKLSKLDADIDEYAIQRLMDSFMGIFMNDQNMMIAANHIHKHLMKGFIESQFSMHDTYIIMHTYSYKINDLTFLGIETDFKMLVDYIPYNIEFIFKKGENRR